MSNTDGPAPGDEIAPLLIFTIGHSTRSFEAFTRLLGESGVDFVVDVRSIPRSRSNPQFNQDTLADSLALRQVGYEHIAELGGRRSRQRLVDPTLNAFWKITAFHNYADYALGEAFRGGLRRLRACAAQRRCVIMCAELLWWRCHRRIIADYLLARGETVIHILNETKLQPAQLTPGARVRDDALIVYPAPTTREG